MTVAGFLQRLRLRHVVFFTLVLSGIIPLAVSSILLIWQNRQVIEEQERDQLTWSARTLSREVNGRLTAMRRAASQLGRGLLILAPEGLRSDSLGPYLEEFSADHPELLVLRVLSPAGEGPYYGPRHPSAQTREVLGEAFEAAREQGQTVYRFVPRGEQGEPAVVLATPVGGDGGRLYVEMMAELDLLDAVFRREGQGESEVFLLDQERGLLWSQGASAVTEAAMTSSGLGGVASLPINILQEYDPPGSDETILAMVSPVEESGWVVVVQKPVAAAFGAVDEMVFNTILSSVLLLGLALLFALIAARRLSQPIQRLAETSHEIADGRFGRRVSMDGLLFELADLGRDFNRMSGHVERYIGELEEAARENRDLFIGSLRAFAAAIDAKDPYTRGHSERVASVSRIIARHLGMDEAFQERIWIAGILHDVGKIGVDDRVLKKGGQLSEEEFHQIKMHTVIGYEIMSSMEQLKEMLPAIRWHHENWNGRGYPDGLRGEDIPLIARIIAVADTFDAVTTNRPYQQAYTLEFAVETITKLTGARFDAKVVTAFLRAYEQGEIQPAQRREGQEQQAERKPAAVRSRVASMT